MRLGDLDALYDGIEARYRLSSGEEHKVERALLDAICDAPTIDAIPVEWIQKFCEDDISEEQRETIEWMLEVWQKEQEAQDG